MKTHEASRGLIPRARLVFVMRHRLRSVGEKTGSCITCLTRSHRRRRIGVQPISSDVATDQPVCKASTRNDTSDDVNSAAPLPLLCEARLNDGNEFLV